MTELEKVFDSLTWERKFEYEIPSSMITRVFRNGIEAQKYFNTHREETNKVYRSAHLFTDSLSQCIAITAEEWE
jgi:hypothetical protein